MSFNFPNLLTLGRIFVIPFYVATAAWPNHWLAWVALGIFVVASITDFLDGYLARTNNQVTAFGRFLDPIADKLLIVIALIVLVWTAAIAGWAIIATLIIVAREIIVSGLREFLAGVKIEMPVTVLAKWKTTSQMVAIGFLTVAFVAPEWTYAYHIGTISLWLAAALTAITGFDYLKRGLKVIIAMDTQT
ncbi:MAG: CDP-diacylglycerol--glycerol-3-phosphate 3-phosphatidyltransferase [Alphaproteobacteria bacterium]